MKKKLFLLLALCGTAHAQSATDVARSIGAAHREIIAVLPRMVRQDIAQQLKAAALNGTQVFLITERSNVRSGGYLLNVSHGPETIRTYLYPGTIPQPWVMVDGAWVAAGDGVDAELGPITVIRDAATLKRLSTWATQVTQHGPTNRVDIIRLRYTP